MRRLPYVAGYFYPAEPEILVSAIKSYLPEQVEPVEAVGAVSPHAGYEYSGPVAAAVYSSVKIPEDVIILGPSHHLIRSLFAIYDKGSWQMPMGEVPINIILADLIKNESSNVKSDLEAHRKEHSIEVQVPFLQFFQKNLSIIPILISHEARFDDLVELGQSIASAVQKYERKVLLVASTDMSHYVSQKLAEELDYKAISFIKKLDARGLFEVVVSFGISMCGFQPTTALLVAVRKLGATEGKLIKYQTSGERTGDYREVVGYAGLIVR